MNRSRTDYLHPRSPTRRWAWLGVALLHLMLLAFFLHVRQASFSAMPKAEPQAQWVTMRLFSRPSLRPTERNAERLERMKAETRMPHLLPRPSLSARPEALTIVSPSETPSRITAQLPVPPPPEPAASNPDPLKLKLPLRQAIGAPISAAEMARLDPRSNTRRPDVGERIASALGSPQQTEEAIAPGHTRIREGSSCLDVQDARVSQLFPFDAMGRGAPKMVSSCKK